MTTPRRMLQTVPRLLLAATVVACSKGQAATSNGEVAQDPGELERALAANPTLRDAVKFIGDGHPWKATVAVAPLLKSPAPAVVLVAARAAAAWDGWPEVDRLLSGQRWLDSSFGGEGRELLARAELATGSPVPAIQNAAAAVARSPDSNSKVRRSVLLARALDRDNRTDSAAALYRMAATGIPAVADWLLLRAAGAERDSAARSTDYSRIRSPIAKSRIPWTEAQSRERFGDHAGAAERFAALGARGTALRLRLGMVSDSVDKLRMKDSLIAFLHGAARDDARQTVQALDAASVTLSPRDELAIGRALSGPGPLSRAVTGYQRADRGGALRPEDRLQYAAVLVRLGQLRDAQTQLDSIGDATPVAGQAAFQRARITLTANGGAAAVPLLRAVADRYANDTSTASSALYLLADLLTDAAKDDSAIATYRELYRKYPTDSRADDARFRAAILDFAGGRTRPAAMAFDSLLRVAPNSNERVAARYWSGRAWKALGDGTKASADWQSLLAEQPSSYYGMAGARRLNRPLWAPPAPVGAVLSMSSVDSVFARVDWLQQLGMDAEIRFELDALEERATTRELMVAIATALRDHGEAPRAIRIGNKLIEQGDRDARAYRLAYPLVDRDELVRQAGAQHLDPALIAGLIRQESSFDRRAVSIANARGLMQVLPSVGAEIAKALHYPVWSPVLLTDADVNLQLGTAHLASDTKQYGDVTRVLAAYNAGSTRVDRWAKKTGSDDPELFTEEIPFVETRDYVRVVQRNAAIYRALYGMK